MDCSQIANMAASALVALCCLAFMGAYQVLAPWRSTVYGRHLMAMAGAICGLGLYTVAVTLWPGVAQWLRLPRILLLLAIAGLMLQRAWLVIKAQRHRE